MPGGGGVSRYAAELGRRLAACGVRRVEHVLDEAADAPIRSLFAAKRR